MKKQKKPTSINFSLVFVKAQTIYQVRYCDTFEAIAPKLGTTVLHLQSINELRNTNLIYPEQTLRY